MSPMLSKTRPATAVKSAMSVTLASLAVGASTTSPAHAQDAVQWRVEDGGNGHWYAVRDTGSQLAFSNALVLATNEGGHLATVRSIEESNIVFDVGSSPSLYRHPACGPWIGAQLVDDEWGWSNGEPWDFTNWYAPNPDSPPLENRACLTNFAGSEGQWNDLPEVGGYGGDLITSSFIIEWSSDCNNDDIVDYGQILDGTFEDLDQNGVPDPCDQPGGFDGILDVPTEYSTIQEAIDAAPDGTRIVVAPGVYAENLLQNGSSFILEGSLDEDGNILTTIDGGGVTSTIVTGGGGIPVFRNLCIRNGYREVDGGGMRVANDAVFEHCIITENTSARRGGGVFVLFESPIFDRCLITGNDALGLNGEFGDQFVSYDGGNPTISSSVICGGDEAFRLVFGGIWTDGGGNVISNACPTTDCDGNGLADLEEALDGAIVDLNLNFIPDACEPDCDGDGTIDDLEVDCDSDGVPDECQLSGTLSVTEPRTPTSVADFIEFDVSSMSDARDTVVVELSASGDLATTGEFMLVYLDDASIGLAFVADGAACDIVSTTFEIPAADWNAAGLDGTRLIRISGNAIDPTACPEPFTAIDVTVPIVFEDCNANGSWDACDIADGTDPDSDGDGLMDSCDGCPNDPNKSEPGACGCGVPETGDTDGDGILDCIDPCPTWPYDCSEDGQTIIVAVGQSIQEAINQVPQDGTVQLGPGTHQTPVPNGLVSGDRDLRIHGTLDSNGDLTTTLDAGSSGRHLELGTSGHTHEFRDLRLINGSAANSNGRNGGSVLLTSNNLARFANCEFQNNTASDDGGAIFLGGSSELVLDQCDFEDNSAGRYGGAIYETQSSRVIADACMFQENQATGGGAIWYNDSGQSTILACQFEANRAAIDGGAIEVRSGTSVSIHACDFVANFALESFLSPQSDEKGGGAIQTALSSTVDITGSRFLSNFTSASGGAICNAGSTITISDCAFSGNASSFDGDAIANTLGGTTDLLTTDLCDNGAVVVDIDGGHDHSIALLDNGRIVTWGSNAFGQCAIPDDVLDRNNPTNRIVAGAWHNLAVLDNGSIRAWGANGYGQASPPQALIDGSIQVVDVAAGDHHSMALAGNGTIFCWGRNDIGQCDVPEAAQDPANPAIKVIAGGYHSMAILTNGDLVGWGENLYGQLEVPNGVGSGGLRVLDAVSAFHVLALLEDGSIACWGRNNTGQCDIPPDIGTPNRRVTSIHRAAFHSWVVLEDNTIVGWGGTSPQGIPCPCPVPPSVASPSAERRLLADGIYHSLAVLEDGDVFAWGWNGTSQTDIPAVLGSHSQISGSYTDLGDNCISDICDSDTDGTLDCVDGCPGDPNKIDPGQCGCGVEDVDTDGDGIADCVDPCPSWPYDCSSDGQTIFVAVGQSIQDALYVVPEDGIVSIAEGTFPIEDVNGLIKTTGDFSLRGSVDAENRPTTILDAGGSGRLLTLTFGQTQATVIEDLWFINGARDNTAGAVGLNGGTSPTFKNCWFQSNSAGIAGGAIHVMDAAPRFERCRFLGNIADGEGGAVFAIRSAPEFVDCLFDGNTAAMGGGLVLQDADSATVVGSVFLNNIADRGGAIETESSALDLTSSRLSGNIAFLSGAAIEIAESDLHLESSIICANGPAEQVSGMINDLGDNCILDDCGDDLDGNGIPDGCDPDCNGDGLPDGYEIETGTQLDCDGDGLPDDCAIIDGVVADCNGNGIPDSCDIADGTEEDDNLNEVPDSCDIAAGDLNVDGCIDSGDLGLLIALWGLSNPPLGDLNGDGIIGAADLGLLIGNWTPCEP